jgi:hypothetical protein
MILIDEIINISKASYFLIPIYLIADIITPKSMIGGVPHVLTKLKGTQFASQFMKYKPVYSKPKPVYSQPKPVYIQPKPVYSQPKPVYSQPQSVYSQPQSVYNSYNYSQPRKTKLLNTVIIIIILFIINYIENNNCEMKKIFFNNGIISIIIYMISYGLQRYFIHRNTFISKLMKGVILFIVYNFIINMSNIMNLNKCKNEEKAKEKFN